MKSIRILAIVATFFTMTSSASSQTAITTPLELNDYFVSISDSLYIKGYQWSVKLGSVAKNGSFDSLVPLRLKIETYIYNKRTEVKNMKDIKNSTPLRQAFLDLLDYEAMLVHQAFVPFERFNAKTKEEELKAAFDNLVKIANMEEEHMKKIRKIQVQYGTENGFTIEGED